MLVGVAKEGARVGLQLHPDKTKIQHNGIGYGSGVRKAIIQEMTIEVLDPLASTMYRGRALTLIRPHDAELQHRIKKAWAKFGTRPYDFYNKGLPLTLRMKLLSGTVTPIVVYGSGP